MNLLRNIKILIIGSACFYFIFTQVQFPKKHSLVDDLKVPENFKIQPDSIRNKIYLNNLIQEISALDCLEAKHIGIEGRESKQVDYLGTLKKWSDIDELVKLTDHKNPLVRTLAFQALIDSKHNGLEEIFKKHLKDSQTYNYHSGCVVEPVPVNIAFYQSIYSTLSPAKANYFKQELLKESTGFEFMLQYL